MGYKIYNKETILSAAAQLMGFVNFSFCAYGMQLAMERELADLKGTVDPETFTGIEFDLLDGLNDPVIRIMMEDVMAINDTIRVFLLINSMDELETMADEEGSELANEIHGLFTCSLLQADHYDDILSDIISLYHSTTYTIYLMALLLSSGGIDLFSHFGDEYWDESSDEWDITMLDREDKNVSLLYDLILSRTRQEDRMLSIYLKDN